MTTNSETVPFFSTENVAPTWARAFQQTALWFIGWSVFSAFSFWALAAGIGDDPEQGAKLRVMLLFAGWPIMAFASFALFQWRWIGRILAMWAADIASFLIVANIWLISRDSMLVLSENSDGSAVLSIPAGFGFVVLVAVTGWVIATLCYRIPRRKINLEIFG
ncbi:MAG: hypothetical protein ACKVOE_09480 [Rickettsiales bacterium]